MGNDEITDAVMRQAARDVNVLDFIESLPNQFDEPVQERGTHSRPARNSSSTLPCLAYNPASSSSTGHLQRRHRHRVAHPRALERMVEAGRAS